MSANTAPVDPKSATGASPICAHGGAAELGVFQAIFEQLSQAIATEDAPPQAQASDSVDVPPLPNLPDLPDVPPPAIATEQLATGLPVKEVQPPAPDLNPDHAAEDVAPEEIAIQRVATPPISTLPANVQVLDEPVADVAPEPAGAEEKPEKHTPAKCDSQFIPPQAPLQPVAVATDPPPPQQIEDSAPVIPESTGKRRPAQPEKATLPKLKEVDEAPLKEIQPRKAEADTQPVQMPDQVPGEIVVSAKDDSAAPGRHRLEPAKLEFTLPQPHIAQKEIEQPAPPPPLPPDQAFIQSNHPKIITAIHGELLPNGGSMHIRMDPPELGALAIQIDVRDGIVTASFQTSNDEATRLLSHSLGQLRSTLESAGVSVEKLQVQQAPREHFNSNSRDQERAPGQQAYERSAHDDRQRREMLQRMWRRLTIGRDMLDLVA
ncbi:MAG TPA: flagellar hook-length control protein FliK [Tepidisphaeraceae bacterium]|nr:flagellar hook-length control protein FliK [Tepidisphaeraceae bacterium]